MSVETIKSICEIINQQEEKNIQLVLLCDWTEQSISLYISLSEISDDNPVILGMVFGGLIGTVVRRYYLNHLRKNLLKII